MLILLPFLIGTAGAQNAGSVPPDGSTASATAANPPAGSVASASQAPAGSATPVNSPAVSPAGPGNASPVTSGAPAGSGGPSAAGVAPAGSSSAVTSAAPTGSAPPSSTSVSTAVPSASDPAAVVPGQDNPPAAQWWCNDGGNATYCPGSLLQDVQLSRVFSDSKTFVDRPTNGSQADVFSAWAAANNGNVTAGQVVDFVLAHTTGEGQELAQVAIQRNASNVTTQSNISDPIYAAWVDKVDSYWDLLIRESNRSRLCNGTTCDYSLIPLNHTIVVPGGRYREVYYWDSYWILQGLLASKLEYYAWSLLQNFMDLIEDYGFIPNGGRKYYLNRSQPPVFVQMVHEYVKQTGNVTILERALPSMERELAWWHQNRTLQVTSPWTGKNYTVAHFGVNNSAPRPEGYVEDYNTANDAQPPLNASQQAALYAELATGAESGWDYTARWLTAPVTNTSDNEEALRHLNVRAIVPVDLNALMAGNHALLAEMYDTWTAHQRNQSSDGGVTQTRNDTAGQGGGTNAAGGWGNTGYNQTGVNQTEWVGHDGKQGSQGSQGSAAQSANAAQNTQAAPQGSSNAAGGAAQNQNGGAQTTGTQTGAAQGGGQGTETQGQNGGGMRRRQQQTDPNAPTSNQGSGASGTGSTGSTGNGGAQGDNQSSSQNTGSNGGTSQTTEGGTGTGNGTANGTGTGSTGSQGNQTSTGTNTGGGNGTTAEKHRALATNFKEALLDLNWDGNRAFFYDFNTTDNTRTPFYTAAGFWPLWQNVTPSNLTETQALRMVSGTRYLLQKYDGPPTAATYLVSGLNWDFPNVWPPHVYTTIKGLETLERVLRNASVLPQLSLSNFSGVAANQLGLNETQLPAQPAATRGNVSYANDTQHLLNGAAGSLPWPRGLALEIAARYLNSAFCSWYSTGGQLNGTLQRLPLSELNASGTYHEEPGVEGGKMFEKFNITDLDAAGGGGEYTVQVGFGWTNGVVLWAAQRFGQYLRTPTCPLILITQNNGTNTGTGTGTGAANNTGGAAAPPPNSTPGQAGQTGQPSGERSTAGDFPLSSSVPPANANTVTTNAPTQSPLPPASDQAVATDAPAQSSVPPANSGGDGGNPAAGDNAGADPTAAPAAPQMARSFQFVGRRVHA